MAGPLEAEGLKECPVALHSMVFETRFLYGLANNIEEDLYLSRRYHARVVTRNYYDFEKGCPVTGEGSIAFEKDIRDYIHTSHKACILEYSRHHYLPLRSDTPPPLAVARLRTQHLQKLPH